MENTLHKSRKLLAVVARPEALLDVREHEARKGLAPDLGLASSLQLQPVHLGRELAGSVEIPRFVGLAF